MFGVSLHLYPPFVYDSSEGSCESAHMLTDSHEPSLLGSMKRTTIWRFSPFLEQLLYVQCDDDDDELEFNDASTLLGHKRHQG